MIINALVAVKLERCIRAMTSSVDQSNLIAFATALLFTTHPVHTEAVAGMSSSTCGGFDIVFVWRRLFDWLILLVLLCVSAFKGMISFIHEFARCWV